MKRARLFYVWLFLVCTPGVASLAAESPTLDYEHYELSNGLDVILHVDDSVPVVGVNVWYHVGSGNEEPGRTGFAHLFEHMMFQGSANHRTKYFLPLQKFGAFVNGSTNEYRTNYLEDVPADQLELALWLEADRMGFLLEAVDSEKFVNQQDVVSNELRQGRNRPYAMATDEIKRLIYPADHPYRHPVIGSLEDLANSTLDDVKGFFRLYYSPNNASLCLSGDFDPEAARAMIQKYFGGIPPGKPVKHLEQWIPRLDATVRATLEDRVQLPRTYHVWPTPGLYRAGDAEFDLLALVLAGGKTSRLYRRLVYELQIAQDVGAYQASKEIASEFTISVTAAPGHSLREIEEVLNEELALLVKRGVDKSELRVAKTAHEATMLRALQRAGGFGGKADRLNSYNTVAGTPGFLADDLARYRDATPETVQAYIDRYLDLDRRAILHVVPQGELRAAEIEVDRTIMPESSGPIEFRPPSVSSARLANGLEIHVVERPRLPLVQANLIVKSGWSADPADRPGTAALVGDLLDEGTRTRTALEISEEVDRLGARLGTAANFDALNVNLNVVERNLDRGLALLAEVALEPTFPENELERVRRNYLGRIRQESTQPRITALKILQEKVFGPDHPYAQPFTGTGTPESLARLTRQGLVDFHANNFKPNNAALVFVGDITLERAREAADAALGSWKPGEVERRKLPPARSVDGTRIYLVDRPGAAQSTIVGGHLGIPRSHQDEPAIRAMNRMLGGTFISRINMNLREDKGFTYGARTYFVDFRDAGLFYFRSGIHTQYTKDSIVEVLKELNEIRSTRPMRREELEIGKDGLIQAFPRGFATLGGVATQLGDLVQNDLPIDDLEGYVPRLAAVDADDVARVVRDHVRPDELVWVVVGDRAAIEPGLRELGLGDIEIVNVTEP